ncbi:Hypothetical predicted protein [Prunus dulcis]|uniref:Uncharacterized protein n=1 Tax=Prunus dulcis TaxID=3755 RepID=A0A5E4FMU8_PRUDU|nr:Hypothetical predicted protein [Prunus dulcis]
METTDGETRRNRREEAGPWKWSGCCCNLQDRALSGRVGLGGTYSTGGTSPNVFSTCLSLHLLRSHLSYLSFFRRLLLPHLTSPAAASSYLLLSHFVFSIPNPCPLSLLFSLFLLDLQSSQLSYYFFSRFCVLWQQNNKIERGKLSFTLMAIGSNNNRVYNDSTLEQ